MAEKTSWLVALVALAAGACSSEGPARARPDADGSDGGGAGNPDAASVAGPHTCTIQLASPPPDSDPVHAAANAYAFGVLNQIVGQYLRGDVAVYRGSAVVQTNVDAFGNLANQTLDTTGARAALTIGTGVAGLTVFSASERERILFQQQTALPGTTFVSTIFPNDTYGGGPVWPLDASGAASCVGCLPDLASGLAALEWKGVQADAASASEAAPLRVTSSATLHRVSPCALTWDDIFAISADYAYDLPAQPAANGQVTLTLSNTVVTSPASFRACDGRQVPYTIDIYINTANLADSGVRNLVESPALTLCGPA